MAWAAAAPYVAMGASTLLSAMTSDKGGREDPLGYQKARTGAAALNYLSDYGIPGASPLATAGSKAYMGALGQGGVNLADLGPAGEIAATGLPTNTEDFMNALTKVGERNIDTQAKATQTQFGPQGNRYSSDVFRGVGLVREQGAENLNQILADLEFKAGEASANRRVIGTELLSNIGGQARTSALQPVALGVGQQPAPTLPSAISQGLAAITPMLGYMLSQNPVSTSGGPAGPSTSLGAYPASPEHKGQNVGKG